MLLLSRVCAEFRDASGVPLFRVTPRTRLTFQEAPEAIRQDPLFAMLLSDRSIEVTESGPRRKALENNPGPAPEPAVVKAEKTEKAEMPEKAEKAEKAEKVEKPPRGDKAEKGARPE